MEESHIARDPAHLIVWKESSEILGHAIWHESNTEEHVKGDPRDEDDRKILRTLVAPGKEFVELHEVWLKTEYRGKGYGARFFEFFEHFISKKDHDTIVYYADQPAALAICRNRGYREAFGVEAAGRPVYTFSLALKDRPEIPITIEDYDSLWPGIYEGEKERIVRALGDSMVAIEHVGSTAVPRLGAKPIIDIMAAVRELSDIDKCVGPLQIIGYWKDPKFDLGWSLFLKGPPKLYGGAAFHLHLVQHGSDVWERHLLFRDFLRSHPEKAQEYHRLKKELASRYVHDREAYTEAKASFVRSVEELARRQKTE